MPAESARPPWCAGMHASFEGAHRLIEFTEGKPYGVVYLSEQLGVQARRSGQAGVLPSHCEADTPEGAGTVALGTVRGEAEFFSVGTFAAAGPSEDVGA